MEVTKEQEILQKVMSEAWINPAFKKELMDDPQEAIERLTGESISIPEGKTLKVFDQTDPNIVCLNLPPSPDMDNVELTDHDLEMVAGGMIPMEFIIECLPTKPRRIFMIAPESTSIGG